MNIEEQVDFLTARSVDFVSRDELKKKLEKCAAEGRGLRVKYGADPSAPDIHLGHVVGLNKLREFQDAGHTVVFIIGDFTGMIGDPSGKSATRPALSKEQVAKNAESYKEQVFKILDPERTEVRFNSEWLGEMKFEDVIRLTAHVTVAQMLARDDFSKRYAENRPISLVEFLYPLVQAYDSVMIEADIELGGTDQLFNLLLGRELQKVMGQEPQCVMTLPLIEGLDGVQKMSKSLNNYVGVNEEARDMYGKLMSVPDDLMWKYFEYILCWPAEKVAETKAKVEHGELHPRAVKDMLGQGVVSRFIGEAEAKAASEEFTRIFAQKELPDDIPEVIVPAGEIGLLSLMVQAGLCKSNGEARRLIKQGAVRINDEKVTDERAQITPEDGMIIRSGKRGFAQVKIG
ncbi:tyrosine--tRNA ligase [Pontiella agarivorans]|uniref:Tyrosine--tRNA ligase n=1 Tax=Pontiella agarivorans TaxID=3038953 RepID=A0ABU5MW07_9BACT|nr:tyrosine--tRNA ligase [Pontiella agarivorans]MDZ8118303.1 tyrosine--tRNA ligase [Pontiella agarivorans]